MKKFLIHEEKTFFPARGAARAEAGQGNTAGNSKISVAGGRRRGRQVGGGEAGPNCAELVSS